MVKKTYLDEVEAVEIAKKFLAENPQIKAGAHINTVDRRESMLPGKSNWAVHFKREASWDADPMFLIVIVDAVTGFVSTPTSL